MTFRSDLKVHDKSEQEFLGSPSGAASFTFWDILSRYRVMAPDIWGQRDSSVFTGRFKYPVKILHWSFDL